MKVHAEIDLQQDNLGELPSLKSPVSHVHLHDCSGPVSQVTLPAHFDKQKVDREKARVILPKHQEIGLRHEGNQAELPTHIHLHNGKGRASQITLPAHLTTKRSTARKPTVVAKGPDINQDQEGTHGELSNLKTPVFPHGLLNSKSNGTVSQVTLPAHFDQTQIVSVIEINQNDDEMGELPRFICPVSRVIVANHSGNGEIGGRAPNTSGRVSEITLPDDLSGQEIDAPGKLPHVVGGYYTALTKRAL